MNMDRKELIKMLKDESLNDVINKYINVVESRLKNNSSQIIEFEDIYKQVKNAFDFLDKYIDLKVLNKCLNEKECEYVLNDFNKILDSSVETIDELEDILSDKFQEYLDCSEDAQDAYDNMSDCEYEGLIKKYAFVYSLSGKNESWYIDLGENFNDSKKDYYLNIFSEIYNENFKDIYDVTSILENEIMKIMSNCGCDVFNAFNLIIEENFPEEIDESIFVVANADSAPRIELFQII